MKNTSRLLGFLTSLVLICTLLFTMTGCKNNTDKTVDSNITKTDINSNINASESESSINIDSSASADATSPAQNSDNQSNNAQPLNEDDLSGWFSLEVINQYSMAPFVQPPGTTVVSKPQRDCLYLKGDDDAFRVCADYAFQNIINNNTAVYLPVMSTNDDGTSKTIDFNRIYAYDFSDLSPSGEKTSVTFVYTLGHKIYECSLSLETPADATEAQICIAFADRTELYKSLL